MAAQPTSQPSCIKRGLILTCRVNGRKRFRAVPVGAESEAARPTLNQNDACPATSGSVSWAAARLSGDC